VEAIWKLEITIEDFEYKNIEEVKTLINYSNEDEGLLTILKNSIYNFAYIAYIDSNLVGIIFTWRSNYHENSINFRLLSNPLYFAYEIEKELLKQLETKGMNLPLKTSIWETSVTLKQLYEKKLFKEIRRTYMPSLDLEMIIEDKKYKKITDSNKIKTLKEIQSINSLMRDLSIIVKRNYEETHRIDPIATLGLEEWQKLILAEDIIGNGSYVLLDDESNEILAYTFLHESESKDAYELGWCGSSNQLNKKLIIHLVFEQIKFAANQNVKTLIGEFDNTDYFAMEVFKSFPFKTTPTWITFMK